MAAESRAHLPPPAAQWMAMPTKSACALAGSAVASAASGEPAPNTCVMSDVVFSSSMFAVPTPPKSQPARVYAAQGAGVVFCPSLTMFGSGSFAGSTGSVQYLNPELKPMLGGVVGGMPGLK